jgi:ppGpp synthetase/RelA/SpoT-type nucleotidyltranferase
LDIAGVRARFRIDQARYEALAQRVKVDCGLVLQRGGVPAELSARPKTEASFLRKAIVKSTNESTSVFDPFTRIKDRAGVRVVVPHLEAAELARSAIREEFIVVNDDDTRERYAPDQIGYLGLHLEVELKPENCGVVDQHLRGIICEIQIHTRAQSAWATASHPMLYKPVGRTVSPRIARRVMRAVTLVDLFDDEIAAARHELKSEPGYEPAAMLAVLEPEFLAITPVDFSVELSLQVLGFVQSVYESEELEHFDRLISDFMQSARAQLTSVFDAYASVDGDVDPLLFQPEVIAIYERLTTKPQALRDAWIRGPLDISYLDSLRSILGR